MSGWNSVFLSTLHFHSQHRKLGTRINFCIIISYCIQFYPSPPVKGKILFTDIKRRTERVMTLRHGQGDTTPINKTLLSLFGKSTIIFLIDSRTIELRSTKIRNLTYSEDGRISFQHKFVFLTICSVENYRSFSYNISNLIRSRKTIHTNVYNLSKSF